ncbi:uncharacterized protein LOC119648681 [Hermetia illucens]|nr:uncharacterized protein LOC119648681 [Hermetia illucens]
MAKILIAVGIASLCAAISTAYDFKDSAFNEVIFRDLLDLTDDDDNSVLHREVRTADTAAIRVDPLPSAECKEKRRDRGFYCCNDKVDLNQLEIIRGVRKECLAELHGNDSDIYFKFDPFTCEKLEELKKDVTCIAECVGKKFGLLDDSGNIKPDIFLAYLKMKAKDSEWKLQVTDEIAGKCIEDTRKEVEHHLAERGLTSGKICNPSSLKISQCLWREYVRACPKNLQTDSPKCCKLREKIEKGDAVTYKGFYLRHLNDDK